MFVRDFTEVAVPQQRVVDGLSTAESWSSAIVDALDAPDREVLARYGMLGLVGNRSGSTEVRVRSVQRQQRGVVVGIEWQGAGRREWNPVMQADITVSALGPHLSHVDFTAAYSEQSGRSSAAADRVMQQRVLEYAVRLILNRLAGQLGGGAGV